jgi:alkanesulfonate monooxygenase SsuD/methylene tetrahydromethanopterin reductase-like flavin-dependent oxidoreductase (luciferase family)
MVGGMGEKKTLKLVAQYADACNLFPTPELPRKLDVLRRHCEDVGRDYDTVYKTLLLRMNVGPDGRGVEDLLNRLQRFRGPRHPGGHRSRDRRVDNQAARDHGERCHPGRRNRSEL